MSVRLARNAWDCLHGVRGKGSPLLPVASPTPLSQSWQLLSWSVLLDIGKGFMWENGKWKYVQTTVTCTVESSVAFHTAQGKIKLKNSSINNVYVCQSSTSNHEELHVAQLSPVLCGNCLGMSNSSLVSSWIKKGLFCQFMCYYKYPSIPVLVCKAFMQQSLLEYLSWCLTWTFCASANYNPILKWCLSKVG